MLNPLLNPAYSLPPLGAALVGVILLTVVLSKGRRTRGNRLFSGLLICMTLHSLLIFGMRSSLNTEQALIFARIAVVPCFAIFALFYHFILIFTNTQGQRYISTVAYIILILLAALIPTDLMIKNLRVESYGYAPIQGLVTYIISPLTFVFLGGTAYNLVRRYRQSSSSSERNRILYLLTAILFPLLGALLDSFTNLPPAYVWGNLIFCLLTTIAILKYHLLDINIILQRSLVYLVMSAIVAIPYVGILYLLHYFIEPAIEKWWVHSTIILGLAIILHPIYSRAQEWVDRLFYRDRYSYVMALEQFAQEAQSIEDLKKLGDSMTHLIRGALRTSSICLLLPSEIQQGFTITSHVGLKVPKTGVILSNNSPLVNWLDLHGNIINAKQLDVIPQLQSITLKDKDNLQRMEAKLCVPLKTRQGQLSGILILGPKLSQQPYSDGERRLLMTLSSQMAIALENAHLYEIEKTARVELEKLNKQKTEFLHSVAHELKTPLTAVISSSEILSEDLPESREFRGRLINNIRRSAESMNRRITELTNLAKMQIGEIEVELEPLETSRIISEIASQSEVLFQAKEQTLTLKIQGTLPRVNADRARLEEVLLNLLSNANKFSPVGSDIVLRAREADGEIIIEVEDQAPLVTQKEKERLFEPYYRGEDDDERRRTTGLGLGLAISKKLVELHGGKIWVESRSRKGNTFAFSLPVMNKREKEIE